MYSVHLLCPEYIVDQLDERIHKKYRWSLFYMSRDWVKVRVRIRIGRDSRASNASSNIFEGH